MKLFNNQPDATDYFKQAILNEENELEVIFGYSPGKNPINKKIFIHLLEKLTKQDRGPHLHPHLPNLG